MRGEIAWFRAYDVAFEADLRKALEALAGEPAYRRPGRYRRAPESVTVYSPLVLELAERSLPEAWPPGGAPVLRPIVSSVKLFAVGAVSVEIRMPFEASTIGELAPLRDIGDDADGPIGKLAAGIARDFVARARPGLVRPASELGHGEPYTVLCVTEDGGLEAGASAWLDSRKAQVAAFLLGEKSPEVLSADQVEETLRLSFSYTKSDLAIVDWDAMVLVDTATAYDELLYVAEVANLQIAELRTHDEALERAVDRAYEDIERYGRSPRLFRPSAKLAHALRNEMMDLAHIADEIQNLSKHFGDWYLARIYTALRSRFHLAEWETQLERKLKTVSTMYELIQRHATDRKMLALELMIVLLFVIDLVLVLLSGR